MANGLGRHPTAFEVAATLGTVVYIWLRKAIVRCHPLDFYQLKSIMGFIHLFSSALHIGNSQKCLLNE